VINMAIENYLIIENNVVTNVVFWDGNTETWVPPANSIFLVQSTTLAEDWELDSSLNPPDYVLTEIIGGGQIGFTWNGTACVTNEAKPEPPIQNQPVTEGTQEL